LLGNKSKILIPGVQEKTQNAIRSTWKDSLTV